MGCQRVKPIGDPKCPFKSEGDYMDALKAHHAAMACAVKAKQSADPKAAEALTLIETKLAVRGRAGCPRLRVDRVHPGTVQETPRNSRSGLGFSGMVSNFDGR